MTKTGILADAASRFAVLADKEDDGRERAAMLALSEVFALAADSTPSALRASVHELAVRLAPLLDEDEKGCQWTSPTT